MIDKQDIAVAVSAGGTWTLASFSDALSMLQQCGAFMVTVLAVIYGVYRIKEIRQRINNDKAKKNN